MKYRIVIAGGGFAGLTTAMRIAKQNRNCEIILVDQREYHLYTPWLYRLPADAWKGKKRRMVEFDFKRLVKRMPSIQFRLAKIIAVNPETKNIILESGNTIRYDYLVLALGSEVETYGIVKKEEVETLNTPQAVEKMYAQMKNILHRARKKEVCHIAIVGGGPTGVETAMELASLRKKHGLKALKIVVIDAGDGLLHQFEPHIRRAAARQAKKLGLRIVHKARVEGRENGVLLVNHEGKKERIETDMCIWSAGVTVRNTTQITPFKKDKKGRIEVNEYLQIQGQEHIFALGDIASIWDERHQGFVPQTAWAAIAQGNVAGHNIGRILQGAQPNRRYIPPRQYPAVISLGFLHAAGGGHGIRVRGIVGWTVKQLIHVHYFMTIMSLPSALRAWLTKEHLCGLKK